MYPAIVVEGLWEEFRIADERAASIKEVISRFNIARGRRSVWALKDVSFDVTQGESLGLLGSNGSGKSTLLRCIAGILPPTRGEVLVRGAVSSLIELGAGFHEELTGRENIMVTGALFGLSRRELRERFEEIVGFAGLEEVIDRPVRAFSSGMYMRLAFALAASVDPQVLLIDEVLAVGDESFQRKCIRRISELRNNGVTIVFVSHDLSLLERVCERCILLRQGELVLDSDTRSVIETYLQLEHLQPRP